MKNNSQKTKRTEKKNNDHVPIIVATIGLIGTIFTAYFGYLSTKQPETTSIATQTTEINEQSTVNPKNIHVTDQTQMIFIPAGDFLMGSERQSNEQPIHQVYVSAFFINKYEVTYSEFEYFVNSTRYETTAETNGWSYVMLSSIDSYLWTKQPGAYWSYPAGPNNGKSAPNHPVVHMSRQDAQAYCKWIGGRLPTEAEWEKAARGNTNFTYPWGDQFDVTLGFRRLNFCDSMCDRTDSDKTVSDSYRKTSPVGAYLDGASPYGVMDMAGNVWEWVKDWYSESYLLSSYEDPTGPQSQDFGIVRGGSWAHTLEKTTTSFRSPYYFEQSADDIGFRCVWDIP